MDVRGSRATTAVRTRPAVVVAVVCSVVCLLVPRPAYAAPAAPVPAAPVATASPSGGTTIPDSGSVPFSTDTSPTTVATDIGPLAAQITTERNAVALLNEQVNAMDDDIAAANQAMADAYAAWSSAQAASVKAQQDAANAASQAYQDADSMGPLDTLSDDLSGLGALAPGLGSVVPVTPPDPKVLAAAAAAAAQQEQVTFAAYHVAQLTAQALTAQQDTLKAGRDQRNAALLDLISRNQAAAAAADAVEAARSAALAGQYAAGSNIKGQVANPKALAALAFAVNQLGKPYVWGAEGPNSYDCSGLVYAAYRSVGANLPRVARDQQHALTPIPASELLPGDLIFFNPTSQTDWTTVSHVGIYYGNNQMVEAPTFGQSVKIAPVWWSAYFSAARVYPAVPGPTASPTPSPTGSSASPTPSPSGSASPSPSPSGSGSPSPSGSASPTPSQSGSPSPSAPPTTPPATPNVPAGGSPTPTPAVSKSASAGKSTSPAASPSASG